MIDATKLRGPLGWSLASITFIVVFGMYAISVCVSPLLHRSGELEATDQTADLIVLHDQFVAVDIARFNGRSAFFKPIRKPKPPPPPPPIPEGPLEPPEPPADPGPPPPDPRYMGPPLIAIIGNEAWFRGSGSGSKKVIRLKAGEEFNGLTLVSTTEPSMVTVQYRRGNYEIDLFSSEEPFFKQEPPPPASTPFLEEVDG